MEKQNSQHTAVAVSELTKYPLRVADDHYVILNHSADRQSTGSDSLKEITYCSEKAWFDKEQKLIYDYDKKVLLDADPDIEEIVIPDFITEIADKAFSHCSSLKNVKITFPSSLTTIGMYAFCGCNYLTSIKLSNSVEEVGTGAFYDCPFPGKLRENLERRFGEEIFEEDN